jgi:hypothetical protein
MWVNKGNGIGFCGLRFSVVAALSLRGWFLLLARGWLWQPSGFRELGGLWGSVLEYSGPLQVAFMGNSMDFEW